MTNSKISGTSRVSAAQELQVIICNGSMPKHWVFIRVLESKVIQATLAIQEIIKAHRATQELVVCRVTQVNRVIPAQANLATQDFLVDQESQAFPAIQARAILALAAIRAWACRALVVILVQA